MEDENIFFEKVLISADDNRITEYKPFNYENIFGKTSTCRFFDVENLSLSQNVKENLSFPVKSLRRFSKRRKECKRNIKYDDVELLCFKNSKYGEYVLFITENSGTASNNTIYLNLLRKIRQKRKKPRVNRINLFEKYNENTLKSCLPFITSGVSVTTIFQTKNNNNPKKFFVQDVDTKTDVRQLARKLKKINSAQIKQQNQIFPIKNIRTIIILNRNKVKLYLLEADFRKSFKNVDPEAYSIEFNHKKYIDVKLLGIKLKKIKWYKNIFKLLKINFNGEHSDSRSETKTNSSISININSVLNNYCESNDLCNLTSKSDVSKQLYLNYATNQNYFKNILSKVYLGINNLCSFFNQKGQAENTNKFLIEVAVPRCTGGKFNLTKEIVPCIRTNNHKCKQKNSLQLLPTNDKKEFKTQTIDIQDVEILLANVFSINKKINTFADAHSKQNLFGFTNNKQKAKPQKQHNSNNLENNVKEVKNILDEIKREEPPFISTEVQQNLKELNPLLDINLQDIQNTPSKIKIRRKLNNNLIKLKKILAEKRATKKEVALQPKIKTVINSQSNHPIKSKIKAKVEGKIHLTCEESQTIKNRRESIRKRKQNANKTKNIKSSSKISKQSANFVPYVKSHDSKFTAKNSINKNDKLIKNSSLNHQNVELIQANVTKSNLPSITKISLDHLFINNNIKKQVKIEELQNNVPINKYLSAPKTNILRKKNICQPEESNMKVDFLLNPKKCTLFSREPCKKSVSGIIKKKPNKKRNILKIIDCNNKVPTLNITTNRIQKNVSHKPKTGENFIKFFEANFHENDFKIPTESVENLSDFEEKIFIKETKTNYDHSTITAKADLAPKKSKQNQQTDCCDLLKNIQKDTTETKGTSCDDLAESSKTEVPETIASWQNKIANQEKNLKKLIMISQKMQEDITRKKKELSSRNINENMTNQDTLFKFCPTTEKKYDFVQMKAELLSLITEVKDNTPSNQNVPQDNIKIKIEENLTKLGNIIQTFKEDKKQKILTPDVEESIRKLSIIPEENQDFVAQKIKHKIYVNVMPTDSERKVQLFKTMHATLEKITQKMEKNSLVISKVSELKRELRKILGVQDNVKPKCLAPRYQDFSQTNSPSTVNSVMRTKEEITKNIQNSLLLLKNLNDVIKNSKQNPENAMKQLTEIKNSLVAQTGKINDKKMPGQIIKKEKSDSNTRNRTSNINSKASIRKSKFSISVPFIKSTHPVEIKPKRTNNSVTRKNSSKKLPKKDKSLKIVKKLSTRMTTKKENTIAGPPIIETSHQLKLFKIYRPSKSKFCMPVEPDMTDVPLRHLTPFRSEYPRKDHLSNIEIEDTYLYKLVNNLLGHETIEPLIKCGDGVKTYPKTRVVKKKEVKNVKIKQNDSDKKVDDNVWYYQVNWDKEVRKSLFIEPPTPPPTPDLRYAGDLTTNTIIDLDKLVSEAFKFHPKAVQENMKDLLRGVALDKNLKPRNKSARFKVRTPTVSARPKIRTPTLNTDRMQPKFRVSTPQRKTRVKNMKKKKAANSVNKKKYVKHNDVHIK